ncbi:vacuolar protein sorting-associated protein 8 homolog isoform X2 [Phoenix dactylifera]|uniref:Vacuolar protein sorting-associated protein 8 homolog isoform X2 n=1 Tax=Phoenix dactylifera TaxID=42345 RepID=A0A8B8ZGN7_PHODC|nr:vacuolar protein sorting-associated protein 8 homolog isoform X2 [Phoenix dactylifera]
MAEKKPSRASMEELDLDAFLRFHGDDLYSSSSDDDDEQSAAARRRTVDELLHSTSSSSSSSPPTPSRIPLLVSDTQPKEESPIPQEHDQRSGREEEQEEESTSSTVDWRRRSREVPSSVSLSSLGLRSYYNSTASSSSSSSRLLPPLFGSVRPNPKPGAALAAAAATSRSIPTPHAAAIKSQRAGSGSLQKVLEEPAVDPEEVVGSGGLDGSELSEATPSTGNFGVEDDDRGPVVSAVSRSSSEAEVVAVSEELRSEEVSGGGGGSSIDEEIETTGQLEAKEDVVNSVEPLVISDENAQTVDENLPPTDEGSSVAEIVEDDKNEVDLEVPKSEKDDFDKSTPDGEISSVGDEAQVGSEIDKVVEERLGQLENSKKAEKKAEKKLRASMKPLEWAEEIEKRQASSGLHWEEGAAAQPMRLEGIQRGPPAVGYLQIDLDNAITRAISSQAFRHDHGSPQVLAVHMNFIALGMSKGAVLVVPSKYSAYSADNMDTKMSTLGFHGEKVQTPVTSMCFNQQGDLLLVGYGDGHLTVWDVQKATAAKVITGEHTAPVVHTLFLGQDSQVTRQFKAVTGDSKGLVSLHTFSVVPLLNRFSVKTQCLLDGQKTGTVLSASPLLMDETYGFGYTSAQGNSATTSGLGSMMGGVVGGVVGGEAGWKLFNEGSSVVEEGVVIFVTHQNALVVRLSPSVEVYEKFPRPDGVREGSMPYTAWKSTTCLHDSSLEASDRVSWLAIAWDRRVQVAKLVRSEMKRYKEWNLDSAAIGVAWLGDQMLVMLTLRGQLCLFAKDGNELHRTSFIVDGLGIDDMITYHTHFSNIFGNPEKAYQNAVSVRGATIYILGPMHLIISRLLPWKERIQVLQRAGDWMGALDMSMRLYDGHAHGVIDLPRTVDSIREVIMPFLVELLLSYVDEVFSYISIAFCNQTDKGGWMGGPKITDSSMCTEVEEQYARVGGVAVEFCVHIKRTDILFDSIFSKFVAVWHGGTFLEILEPYILRDMLGCLPPEIMQALVEHYSGKGWLQRVEQCVLHMDISSLDFNQVVRLCREHGLYGALIYLFNRGLDDYKTPLEELCAVVQHNQRKDVAAIGYKMLVYLKYCFQGLAFPPGHGTLPLSRVHSVRKELLQFLLEDSKSSTAQVMKSLKSYSGRCSNLCSLLWLDTEATLDVLRCSFTQEEPKKIDSSLTDLAESNIEHGKGIDFESQDYQNVMVQNITSTLIEVLDLESDVIRTFVMDDNMAVWPSKKDLGHILEFIAFLISCKKASISGRVLMHILEYLTSCGLTPNDPSLKTESSQKEKQVLTLLKVVPQTDWKYDDVLHLCMKVNFYQACGLIHAITGQYIAALDSYMKDFNEPVHAFAFINKMLIQLKNTDASSFRSAVISRIPELVKLSRECTFFLVIDQFSSESKHILSELHSHPHSLFLFLKTAVDVHLSGTLNFSVPKTVWVSDIPSGRIRDTHDELEAYMERLSNFPKPLHHNAIYVTDELAELYLELLCQFERNSVLKFLETFDSYRLEHCLRLCQEYGVTDAAAFLLERVGDVGSALTLVMAGLKEKIDFLVAAVENSSSEIVSNNITEMEQLNYVLQINEVVSVHDVLHTSIGLCQRNTQRLDPQESESLWFRLLDSFSEPLKRFYGNKAVSEGQSYVGSSPASSDMGFKKCTGILRRVLSQFVGEIIEGMTGFVPLPVIMGKLLSDNGNQEFGDFRFTILKMLGTYGYERRILDTAKSLIEDDTFYTLSLLKKGASHAYAPQDFTCCICGCSLTKDYSSLGIRVFSCGHSMHLHYESENESSNSESSVACPICLTKNQNGQSKSILVQNGLVKYSASGSQPSQGTVRHLHEPDTAEKSYGLQQMSRFEILSILQKAQRSLQVDTLPQFRLSPPAIYHEKVRKEGASSVMGETSDTSIKSEKPNKRWQLRELRSKGSPNRFPLKSNIFGTEKNKVR